MKKLVSFVTLLWFAISLSAQTQKLTINHLEGDFYVYTTYNIYKGQPVPANAMYLVTSDGVVMIDAPWDTTQFQPLLDSIEARNHQKVVLGIATHYHEDRSGGLDFLKSKGVRTYSSKLTKNLCLEHKQHQAEFTFEHDTAFRIGNYVFETLYPGEGHTKDNIVVLFDKDKILYGGCFIKSTEAHNLGNINDANLKLWPESIKKLQKRFPKPKHVIPGHDGWESNKGLEHTAKLLKRDKR